MTIINLRERNTFSIFENTISIQLLFKKVSHTVLLTWNMSKLTKAFVEVKVLGSGAPMIGEYELFHHLNWNIVNLKNMDLIWNGKAVATALTYLSKPLLGDGQLSFHNFVIDMTMVGKHDTEIYKLVLITSPFQIALLPFFEWP